jgi:hypothetical protein
VPVKGYQERGGFNGLFYEVVGVELFLLLKARSSLDVLFVG